MRPIRLLATFAMVGAALTAAPVAADAPPPEGPRDVATLDSPYDEPGFTADGSHLVMAVDLDDTPELWSWGLAAEGALTPVRISADYAPPVEAQDFAISGDAVVHERYDGSLRSLWVSAVDGSAGPTALRFTAVAPDRTVRSFGVVGSRTWMIDDFATDDVYELRVRDHEETLAGNDPPTTTLSPTQQGTGVGRAVASPDGSTLAFTGRTDSADPEVWVVPIDGVQDDAVRLSPDGTDPIYQFALTPDGTHVVWSTIATDGSTYTYGIWSAPTDGTKADAEQLLTFTSDDANSGIWFSADDPTSRHVLVQMIDDPVGLFDHARVPVDGGTRQDLDLLEGTTGAAPATATWTADGLPLMFNGVPSEGEHLVTYPDGTTTPRDLGLVGPALVDVVGKRLITSGDGFHEVVSIDPATADRKTLLDVAPNTVRPRATPVGEWIGLVRENPVIDSFGLLSRNGAVEVGPFDLDVGDQDFGEFSMTPSPDGSWMYLAHTRDTNDDGIWDDVQAVVLAVPPSAPRNLTVTAGDGTATVVWDPPADGMAPDGYEVTATPTDGSADAPVSKNVSSAAHDTASARVPAAATSTTLDGLTNGVTYKVTVTPYARGGAGVPARVSEVLPLEPGVGRIAGAGRIETAVAASQATFAPGVDVAYVATARNFPDALAAGPAAARDGAPILLTERDALPAATAAELDRLAPGRIVVLGGDAAVADEVVTALAAHTDGTVRRLQGPDRYATAAAIAATFDSARTVYVATGAAFPDALAGAALAARTGAPILLVAPDDVPDPAIEQLDRLAPKRIVILGGEAAVGPAAEGQLLIRTDTVDRLAGPDRFATSAAIADQFPATVDLLYAATGINFPDALAGAAVAARTGSPVVLVAPDTVPDVAATAIQRLTPRRIVVLGGTAAVSDGAATQLDALVP